MLTGIHAARNAVAPAGERSDVWAVNVDGEYHEEASARGGDRLVPGAAADASLEELLAAAFRRFDPWAMGTAVGATAALLLLLGTLALLARGGEGEAPMLSLLGIYLVGYEVSWRGLLLGVVEGGAFGGALGAAIAHAINAVVGLAERALRRELEAERTIDALHGATP